MFIFWVYCLKNQQKACQVQTFCLLDKNSNYYLYIIFENEIFFFVDGWSISEVNSFKEIFTIRTSIILIFWVKLVI